MTSEYLPFAFDGLANIVPQASWVADPTRPVGFQPDTTADAASFNKVVRQSSVMSAAIGQFISDRLAPANVADDGNVTALTAQFAAAVFNVASGAVFSGAASDVTVSPIVVGASNVQAALQNLATALSSAGGITSITAGTGLSGGTITTSGTIALNATASLIAVSPAVNGGTDVQAALQALSTAISAAGGGTVTSITATAPLTGGTITASGSIGLAASGVTAGTYQGITVDGFGRVTGAANQNYLTGITSAQVVAALGFTPGTVTSVTAGNGLSGGTITTSGTIGINAPVSLANGGTNATTAAGAWTNIVAPGGTIPNQVRVGDTLTTSSNASAALGVASLIVNTLGTNNMTWMGPAYIFLNCNVNNAAFEVRRTFGFTETTFSVQADGVTSITYGGTTASALTIDTLVNATALNVTQGYSKFGGPVSMSNWYYSSMMALSVENWGNTPTSGGITILERGGITAANISLQVARVEGAATPAKFIVHGDGSTNIYYGGTGSALEINNTGTGTSITLPHGAMYVQSSVTDSLQYGIYADNWSGLFSVGASNYTRGIIGGKQTCGIGVWNFGEIGLLAQNNDANGIALKVLNTQTTYNTTGLGLNVVSSGNKVAALIQTSRTAVDISAGTASVTAYGLRIRMDNGGWALDMVGGFLWNNQEVDVGAANSAGAGYRYLRVPN